MHKILHSSFKAVSLLVVDLQGLFIYFFNIKYKHLGYWSVSPEPCLDPWRFSDAQIYKIKSQLCKACPFQKMEYCGSVNQCMCLSIAHKRVEGAIY